MRTEFTAIEPTLIVGCGIAGPALAIALRHAGLDAVVYEASSEPRDQAGAFLNLAPNGIRVLRALNLATRVEHLGFVSDRLVFHNERGRLLAEARIGAVTLLRGELSRALRQAAMRAGVRFEFGKRLESVAQHRGVVVARFGDGSVVGSTTLIGADGIHSRTRLRFFPEAPCPAYTGILNLGGKVQTDLEPTGSSMHMVFGRRAFFGYAVQPTGETYWFSRYAHLEEPKLREMESIGVVEIRDRLLELHQDDPPEVLRVLERVSDPIGAHPVYELPVLPRWQRGSVCLVGDSAHAIGPHVGQGASLALEDAFVLAKCLRDLPSPQVAFATFERMRRERVDVVMEYSRRIGQMKIPSNRVTRQLRDWILPRILTQSAHATEWLNAYPLSWESPLPRAIPFEARRDDSPDDLPFERHGTR